MIENQISLFKEAESTKKETPTFDMLDKKLTKLNKMGSEMNKLLTSMIDELQADWTEDEKLRVNDPKKYYAQQKHANEQKLIEENMSKELSNDAIETLKNSTVEGMVGKLPGGQLDRKTYLEVKTRLELIGGKWKGNKVMGFVFNEDPTELLEQIANGKERNIKKEFQFFGTPDDLADYLVELAEIETTHDVLEPSAGQGAIVKAIHRELYSSFTVWAFELMPLNQTFLDKIVGCRVLGHDFLSECDTSFDRIIANPPFNKNQDIDHIRKMYDHLKPGGRLVSIASKHWEHCDNKKERLFKEWLTEISATIEQVPAGRFKESGTTIATCIIIIDK